MDLELREGLAVKSVAKVDREACIVYGVRVCGLVSGNGKRYKREALREAKKLYENVPVYFNHPSGASNARKYEERFGKLFNVRDAADGTGAIDADLKYNPAHAHSEQFLWDAENNPQGMGLSHNANGNGRRVSGGDVLVEQITKVHSVDVVDGPATNYSLFEQEGYMDPLKDSAAPAAPGAGDGDTGNDMNAQIAEICKSVAEHPELTVAEKKKKLQTAIDMMTDDAHGEDAPEPTDEEMQEQLNKYKSPAVKKARRKLLEQSRKALAVEKGLDANFITGVFLEQLVGTNEAGAITLIEDRRVVANKAKAESPKSGGGSAPTPMTPAAIAASIDWKS